MKKIFLVSLLISVFITLRSADAEKEIKAPVSRITVYPDRAMVTHESSAEIPAGKTSIRLTGLSPYIDAQSIQVKGIGEFTILAVNHQNNYARNLEDLPEVKSIRGQIEALQIKIEDEKTAIVGLDERQKFLTANMNVLEKATAFSIEQFKNLMDLYNSNIDQVAASRLKKQRLIRDYEKQLAQLQQQISARIGKQQLPSGEISVSVSADKPVSGKMTFSYVVSNAGWYPSYDIRVDDINKPVVIYYKANVYQNTGNEWKNVKLSFSNATPWIAGNVPVLNPWFVDFYAPPVMMRKSALPRIQAPVMVEEAAVASDDRKELKMEAEAMPVPVEKKVGEMSVTFDVAVPYTIQPDGKIQTIEIQRTTSPAEYRYVTVPKISPLAYLTGNISDWAGQSLLSGEATLYFENAFVGKSWLNVSQLSDTLTISLGPDNSILVKREKRKDFTSRRVIGANKTETYSFLVSVRNNKSTSVKITVNDQIPVSSNSSITIEPLELSGGKLAAETGLVSWELELKPQEKKDLVLSYSVKYPKNQNVVLE